MIRQNPIDTILLIDQRFLFAGTASDGQIIQFDKIALPQYFPDSTIPSASDIKALLASWKETPNVFAGARVAVVLPYEMYPYHARQESVERLFIDTLYSKEVHFLSMPESIAHFLARLPEINLANERFLVCDIQPRSWSIYCIWFNGGKFKWKEVVKPSERRFGHSESILLQGLIERIAAEGSQKKACIADWELYLPEIGREYAYWMEKGQSPDHDLRIDYLSDGKLPPLHLSQLSKMVAAVVAELFPLKLIGPVQKRYKLLLLGLGSDEVLFSGALYEHFQNLIDVERLPVSKEIEETAKMTGGAACFWQENIYSDESYSFHIPLTLVKSDKSEITHHIEIRQRGKAIGQEHMYTVPLEENCLRQKLCFVINDQQCNTELVLRDYLVEFEEDFTEAGRRYKLIHLSLRVDGCGNLVATVCDTSGNAKDLVLMNIWEKESI